jgi:hypothetical protein
MAEASALVPAVFHPLVPFDAGAAYSFSDRFDRTAPKAPRQRTFTAEEAASTRTSYTRDGILAAEKMVGALLDIYA